MPSSATITAFYSFTANSRARASQVNSNFSIFRGHILPVDPNTQTAVNSTYDLGSSEYYWRAGYFGSVDIKTSTSTATLTISGDTSAAGGAFVFKIEGVEVLRQASDGLSIYEGGTLVNKFSKTHQQCTSSAAIGQIGFSPRHTGSTYVGTSTGYNLANSTVTVATSGKPVEVWLTGFGHTTSGQNGTIENPSSSLKISILRSGSTLTSFSYNSSGYISLGEIYYFDSSVAAGTYTYSICIASLVTGSAYLFPAFHTVAKEI